MCTDKDNTNLSAYDVKVKENTLSTSEKIENTRDSYVHIYEYGKLFCTSTFKRACAAQETTISNMKEIADMYKYDMEEIHDIK